MPSVQINLNGKPLKKVRESLQANFEHHGIQGMTLTPLEGDNPELFNLSWQERKTGVAGVLNKIIGAEQESVFTAIAKSGAEVKSEVKRDAGSVELSPGKFSGTVRNVKSLTDNFGLGS